LETELNAVIARQLSSSVIISTVIAALMTLALWSELHSAIVYWFIALFSASVLRLSVAHLSCLADYEQRMQLPLTLFTALIWGATAPLFLSALDIEHQMLLILVLIGIVAGSSNSYAGRMPLFYGFMLPILVPLSLWLFTQDGQAYTTIGMIIVIYILSLSIYTKRNTELLKTSIMQNNQLSDEISLRKAHEQRLELQQRILDAIARHRGSLSEILNFIVQQAEADHSAMRACIVLRSDDGTRLIKGSTSNLPLDWNPAIDGIAIDSATGLCATAALHNGRIIVSDISTDPAWQYHHAAALACGVKACCAEPVRDTNGDLIGVFSISYHDARQPSDTDLSLLEHLAKLSSIAIDNYYNRIELDVARQQQAELMDTIRHSSDLIYVYDVDGVITSANEASKTAFGDEIIGKNIASMIAPDHLQLAQDMIQKKLTTGENTVYELDAIDAHAQRHHLEINSSLIVRDGKTIGFSGIARDITARKKAEAKLSLLIQAIDACHESIIVLNAEGEVEFANPAAVALYQQPLEAMLGSNAALLRGGMSGDTTYHDIISTIKQGKIWSGELQFQPAEGDDVQLIARRVSPISDELGQVHHQICIDRDITEATARNKQLEHTQRLESLGVLAGGIAHDFNNLLTVIMGNAALVELNLQTSGGLDVDKTAALLSRVRESSQQAAELCKQMLDYAGKGHFMVEPVNVSTLIRDMARLMDVSIGKHITTHYSLNEDLPLIAADPAQIQQVILNLITNANEAIGDESGEITFSTGMTQATQAELSANRTNERLAAGRYVYIEVSDNGCGMDARTLKKMFDPFFTTKFIGRGLGMSSMMGIVRAHHGAVLVHSQKGIGSSLRILLPRSTESLQQTKEKQAAFIPVDDKPVTSTILVVDDEEHIREISCALIQHMGFAVLQASDGVEAVAVYRQHQAEIDAVLLDMTMPNMDGQACFGILKDINPDVKVLLSSGYSEQKISEIFSTQAPSGFIQKPYMPGTLQQQIKQLIGQTKSSASTCKPSAPSL